MNRISFSFNAICSLLDVWFSDPSQFYVPLGAIYAKGEYFKSLLVQYII